ncbi:hypothetical protein G3O07_02410 [Pseudomonas laurentiana]|uniref:Uncharacterized protein n=1 Tax=Pseudomonas laurentiana TaxID=2364649 RepID=A0A6I5RM90_9PSED|nr:hypothetical protein [Pseudomonas laurentiana]
MPAHVTPSNPAAVTAGLTASVTAPTFFREKTGNTETNRQNLPTSHSSKIAKPLILLAFKKLARHLLYVWYNNNKKCDNPIKTRRNDSGITRTTTAETQLTDFFGDDVLFGGVPHDQTQRTIKLPQGSACQVVSAMMKADQRSKKIRLLLIPDGDRPQHRGRGRQKQQKATLTIIKRARNNL